MVKLSVEINEDNEKLERSIIEFKEYTEFLENSSKILGEEITNIRNTFFKLEKC